jgi:sugar phosphate isomerase/epimerase
VTDVAIDRIISLAAGTVLDVPPAGMAAVAVAAGFGGAGVWFDPDSWTDATTRAVATAFAETGVIPLDIEPIILGRSVDPGDHLVDVAMEIGVRHVLVASGPAERGAVVERIGQLAARATGSDVTLVLEFLPIFSVATLADAYSIVAELGAPNVGILVDTLHLDRSGSSVRELTSIDGSLFPYVQLADAGADAPTTRDALREEALHGRLLPGEGVLALDEVLEAIPYVPISVELRSRLLMERYPDPVARAKRVYAATARI